MITHEISLDNFYKQIGFILDQWKPHGLSLNSYQNVVIGGLGGSGIGGRISKILFSPNFPVPIEVVSDYHLPAFANEKTLVILSSYSGNTEETLSLFAEAKSRGCKILAISSGGFLTRFCGEEGIQCYLVEKGYQPRMALGFSLSCLLLILAEFNQRPIADDLHKIAVELSNNASHKQKAAEIIAAFGTNAQNKYVVVCDGAFEAVAIRFCQQIQENAKGEAFVSVLPEANHNMIESYYEKQNTNFIFLNSGNNPKIDMRFAYLKQLLSSHNNVPVELGVPKFSLSRIYEVIHILDWVSIYLSNQKGVNNMEVPNISRLKTYLDEKIG